VSPVVANLGDVVTISWAVNTTEPVYLLVNYQGAWDAVNGLNPLRREVIVLENAGTLTYQIPLNIARLGMTFELQVERGITLATAEIAHTCPEPSQDCDFSSNATQQIFEHGFLMWVEKTDTIIFSNFEGFEYGFETDTFDPDVDPDSDPTLTPPAGLLQPTGRLGKFWRENLAVRELLGWAVGVENAGIYTHFLSPYSRYGQQEKFGIDGGIQVEINHPDPQWNISVPQTTLPVATPIAGIPTPTTCPYQWFFTDDSTSFQCPETAPRYSVGAQQIFQNGIMLWIADDDRILAMTWDGCGRWDLNDTFDSDTDPISDPNLAPPAGLLQPDYGFGKVWRETARVRDALGWATAPPNNYSVARQQEFNESGSYYEFIGLADGQVLTILHPTNFWKIGSEGQADDGSGC
jgi:hypothetical protein